MPQPDSFRVFEQRIPASWAVGTAGLHTPCFIKHVPVCCSPMAHLLYALPGLLLVDMFAVCPYMADLLFSPDRLKRYS